MCWYFSIYEFDKTIEHETIFVLISFRGAIDVNVLERVKILYIIYLYQLYALTYPVFINIFDFIF